LNTACRAGGEAEGRIARALVRPEDAALVSVAARRRKDAEGGYALGATQARSGTVRGAASVDRKTTGALAFLSVLDHAVAANRRRACAVRLAASGTRCRVGPVALLTALVYAIVAAHGRRASAISLARGRAARGAVGPIALFPRPVHLVVAAMGTRAVGVAAETASGSVVDIALLTRREDVIAALREEPAFRAEESEVVDDRKGVTRSRADGRRSAIGQRCRREALVQVAYVRLHVAQGQLVRRSGRVEVLPRVDMKQRRSVPAGGIQTPRGADRRSRGPWNQQTHPADGVVDIGEDGRSVAARHTRAARFGGSEIVRESLARSLQALGTDCVACTRGHRMALQHTVGIPSGARQLSRLAPRADISGTRIQGARHQRESEAPGKRDTGAFRMLLLLCRETGDRGGSSSSAVFFVKLEDM